MLSEIFGQRCGKNEKVHADAHASEAEQVEDSSCAEGDALMSATVADKNAQPRVGTQWTLGGSRWLNSLVARMAGFRAPRAESGGSCTIKSIGDICDLAVSDFYAKKLPPYEKIEVLFEGKRVPWSALTTEQQLALLRDGARGGDAKDVEDAFLEHGSDPGKMADSIRELVLFADENPQFRSYHGAKHAIRAALEAEAVARLYAKIFKEFEDIGDREIYDAIMAAIFHDSGRQSEGIDIFDSLSARNAVAYIKKLGFPSEMADACAGAILHKDDAVAAKGKSALLLHEADCLEYRRLGGFDRRYLDAYARNDGGEYILTPADGLTVEDVEIFLGRLIDAVEELIVATGADVDYSNGENKVPTYAEMRGIAEKLHMFDIDIYPPPR